MAYSFKQRKDGGFDFFDASGKKTNIESYTKNTGANINQLRQKLATQGDTQSQRIVAGLPTQFRAPTQQQSTPSVFNTPIVRTPTVSQAVSQPTIQAPKVYTPKAQQAYTDAKIIGTGRPDEVKQAITRTVDRKNSVKLDPQFQKGKSYEDIARDAGFSIDEVKRYAERNHKGYGDLGIIGNAARAIGQFVGTTADNAAGIVRKPISTLAIIDRNNQQKINDNLSQINKDLYYRNITPKAAQERASALTKDLIGMKATQDQKTGMYRLGDMNTAEFTGQFAQQGIDSASLLPVAGGAASGSARIASALGNKTAANTLNKAASVMTAGAQTQATSKLANALTARGMNPQTANLVGNAITSNAKQSLVYGSAQTGADVASGRGITPESLAMNYGADFLMGAVPEIGLGSVGRGIDLNNAKVHQELVRTNPTYKANTDKLTGIDATIARAQANGDIRALEGLETVKAQLSDSNALIARRYAEQGFLGGKNATGFKDADDPTAALKAEALKYGTAEEFVRAQGNAGQVANALKVVEDAKKSGVMTSDVIKAYNTLAKNNVVDMSTIPVEHRQYVAKKTWEDATTRVSNLEQMYTQARTPQPKPEVAQAKATMSVEPKKTSKQYKDAKMQAEADYQASQTKAFTADERLALQQLSDGYVQRIKSSDLAEAKQLRKEYDRLVSDKFDGKQWTDAENNIDYAIQDAYDAVRKQPKPVAQPKIEAPKQPTPFEQDLKKAGFGTEPDAYRKQPKDVKKAIDTYIANENPQLAYALDSKLHFPDGIPKVRPEDVKRITGLTPREAGIPPIYVSRNATPIDKLAVEYEITVRGNTSGELKMTSEDFLDTMMDAIEANRSVGQQTKLIRELRNNPDVIAKAKATLEAERAQYGAPEVVEPSKSDIKAYEKMVTQQTDKTPDRATPTQPQNQVSKTTQSQPAASAKRNGVARLSKRDLQAKVQGQESASMQLQNRGLQTTRTYTDNTTDVVKKRGFTKSVKASDEVSAETRRKVNGKYNVRSTEKLALSANDFATGNLKKISEDVHARLDTKLGSIGDQDIADAIAVAKRLDFKRDFTGSQAIYDKLAEHGTKGGQTIQAFSLLRNRTPEGVKYQMLKNLKKAGVKLTDIEQKEVGKLIDNVRKTKVGTDARDRALFDTLDYVSRRIPSTNADKLVNFWRAGLLTAPKTTGGNILGNTTELATQKLWTNPVAIATDKFFSMFTGKRTKTLASGGIKGAKEGVSRGLDYLKTGYDPRDMPTAKYDAPRRINYKNKVLDTYVNGVYRWMGAQDQPFYYAAKSAAAYDLAKADGMNLKYKGQQLADYIEKSVADAEWKPQTFKTAKDVADYAKYAVYQNETLLGSLASGMKQGASRFGNGKGKALVDFVLPFTQVPSSVAMRIIDRTPIGTAREVIKQIRAKSFDQRAMAEAVGNGSFGIPVIAAGYALAASGELTGQYPTDNAEKKLWEAQGKQPYSVRVGDRWYSLNYMQPFGTLMAVGKQVHDDKADGKSDGEAWMNATGSAAKSIESQSFLKGLNGVLSAVNDPNRSMAQYARSTASSVVPNFIRSGAAATDSKQRDMETPFDAFKGAVPGARQTLPVRQDMFGAELESKDNPINMYTNPLNPSKVRNKNDATTNELDRLHKTDNSIVPTEFTKASIGGVTLTSAQVRNLNELVNTEVKSEWDKAIQSDNYKSLADEEKATYLKKIKDAVGNNVKKQFVADNMLASTTTYKSSAVPGSPSASGISTAVSAKTPASAKSILETYDTLDTEARKKWNTEKNTDAAVTKGLQSWLGDKVKIPEVTNDVAKEWADFQNDYAAGKVSKLKENDQKKAILKKAFNSQLSTDEKEIHTLTKAELQYYYDNGVITDENINKAIAVEKQLFEAGLIAKETLQRNLGSSARGYKTSSGSSGRKTSTKTASKASIAELLASQKQINDINNSTYLSLSKLLGSVTSGSSKMAKNKIGREVTLKKITGAKA